jgi:hypothetical protein
LKSVSDFIPVLCAFGDIGRGESRVPAATRSIMRRALRFRAVAADQLVGDVVEITADHLRLRAARLPQIAMLHQRRARARV